MNIYIFSSSCFVYFFCLLFSILRLCSFIFLLLLHAQKCVVVSNLYSPLPSSIRAMSTLTSTFAIFSFFLQIYPHKSIYIFIFRWLTGIADICGQIFNFCGQKFLCGQILRTLNFCGQNWNFYFYSPPSDLSFLFYNNSPYFFGSFCPPITRIRR